SIATLLQRFVPGFGAEEGLAGLRELAFRGLQRLLRLRQPLLRGRDLATQPVDVRLAPGEHGCPVHARRRWIEQPAALLGALVAQAHDLVLDRGAGIATLLHHTLLLQHDLARGLGAMLAQLQQRVEGVAFHPNSLRSASADFSNGTSSVADCCSNWRMAPIFSIATSASLSVPRLYSPSCSSSSMSWYLASYLRSRPAARCCLSSATRVITRLRLVSTSIAG